MSGHSKWANIKHRKDAADKKRGSLFTKLAKEIMVATRIGGSDISSNNRLRLAVTKARSANMSRDTIERNIKKGAGEAGSESFEEILYEIYATGGVAVIVEALTEKKARTTPDIKAILNKHGWSLAETNAVTRLFQRAGYMVLDRNAVAEDALMEIVLEAGADDLKLSDTVYEIFTSPASYADVSDALLKKNLETLESGIKYLPLEGTEIVVDDLERAQKITKVMEILEEYEDVQAVYGNMTLSESVALHLESA